MKKGISLLLVFAMILTALAGCGNEANMLTGTWNVDSVELDGARFKVSELAAMDQDDWMGKTLLVLKDGGKAYVAEGGVDGVIVDWYETTDGKVLLDGTECTMVAFDDFLQTLTVRRNDVEDNILRPESREEG